MVAAITEVYFAPTQDSDAISEATPLIDWTGTFNIVFRHSIRVVVHFTPVDRIRLRQMDERAD